MEVDRWVCSIETIDWLYEILSWKNLDEDITTCENYYVVIREVLKNEYTFEKKKCKTNTQFFSILNVKEKERKNPYPPEKKEWKEIQIRINSLSVEAASV